MKHDQIRVDVPVSDARRDRVEREVFSQLATLRAAERGGRVALLAPPTRAPWFVFAVPAACVVALGVVLLLGVGRDRDPEPSRTASPSQVVTPLLGSSRFTVGDAIIDAGSDTSVKVVQRADGVTLVLERGTIDCDVMPRSGREPFRVLSGEIEVEVVGTRFAVTRLGSGARVDVTRGKVRVRAPSETRVLTDGESWTPLAITPAVERQVPTEAATTRPSGEEIEMAPPDDPGPAAVPAAVPAEATRPARPTPREAFAAAQRLEAKDPTQAAKAYRTISRGRDAWAALALYSLAELHAADPPTALGELDELARRFPGGANAEDAAWLRVDVLRRAGRSDEVRIAAAAYLRAFPQGTYVGSAAKLATAR